MFKRLRKWWHSMRHPDQTCYISSVNRVDGSAHPTTESPDTSWIARRPIVNPDKLRAAVKRAALELAKLNGKFGEYAPDDAAAVLAEFAEEIGYPELYDAFYRVPGHLYRTPFKTMVARGDIERFDWNNKRAPSMSAHMRMATEVQDMLREVRAV